MSVAPDLSVVPPRPDPDAAFAFLGRALPDGPWVLNSCAVEGGPPDVTTILPAKYADGGADTLRRWLFHENMERGRNTYVALNPSATVHDKKARKTDVTEARMMWVDSDPETNDLEGERATRLGLLRQPRDRVPPPSVIIDSGRGYWGLWLLDAPLALTSQTARDEYESRLKKLIPVYTADKNCWNLDRICRLPGSVNWPKEAKRAQGATPRLATVVEATWAVYPYDAFPCPSAEISSPHRETAEVVPIIEPRRLADVDELDGWPVKDRIKVIIVQGHDPENPKKGDNSRSAWVFDVACQLARADVPDAVMLGVLTDPGFAISDSILEKRNPQAEALRVIQRAKVYVRSPALAELNDKHAVLACEGGKCRVMSYMQGDDGREYVALQSFEDFRNRYMHLQVTVGTDAKGQPVQVPMGAWWLKQAGRRQYEALTFRPGAPEQIGDYLNLWRGWGVEPRPGSWALMRDHVEKVLASGNAEHADYILRFAAWAVQNPAAPAEVALVLRGGKGTGKGMFARAMTQLFGQHGMQVTHRKHIFGSFNAHLRDVCLLFADEAFASGEPDDESILKSLITEPTLVVEGKHRDAVSATNHLHIIMASDQEWVAPARAGERRFAIFDVSAERKDDWEWFGAITAEMDGGGREAMLHDLLTMDLGRWHPRGHVPQTEALQRQKELGLSPLQQWIAGLLTDGVLPGQMGRPDRATAKALGIHARDSVPRLRDEASQRIAAALKAWGCRKVHTGERGWEFPPLGEMRAAWERKFGKWAWGDDAPAEWGSVNGGRDDCPF